MKTEQDASEKIVLKRHYPKGHVVKTYTDTNGNLVIVVVKKVES